MVISKREVTSLRPVKAPVALKSCPVCPKVAYTLEDVGRLFGYRMIPCGPKALGGRKSVPQSRCRKCR
jgi:hypothetical protein